MLFRGESSVLDILNESTYLQPFGSFSPQTIPLVSLDEDTQLIEYDHLKRMMSDVGVNLDEAKIVIAEANGIDPSTIITAIPEYEMILNPMLKEEVGSFVLTPLPTTSDTYRLCEACVSLYEETMDETYLHLLMEDDVQDMIRRIRDDSSMSSAEKAAAIDSIHRVERREQETAKRKKEEEAKRAAALEQGKKDAVAKKAEIERLTKQQKDERDNRGIFHSISKAWDRQSDTTKNVIKGGVAAAATVGIGYGIKKYMDNANARLRRIQAEAANAPRTVLAKKVAALRGLYQNYLNKARMERSQQRAGIFKTIASKILGVIDFLLKKIQHVVN